MAGTCPKGRRVAAAASRMDGGRCPSAMWVSIPLFEMGAWHGSPAQAVEVDDETRRG